MSPADSMRVWNEAQQVFSNSAWGLTIFAFFVGAVIGFIAGRER